MIDYVGQQFGNYRLLRFLGQGGFAEVYLGDLKWAKEVSIYRVEQIITTSYVQEREEWIIALKSGDAAKFPFKNKQQVLQMSDEKIHSACFWAGSEEEVFFINLPI